MSSNILPSIAGSLLLSLLASCGGGGGSVDPNQAIKPKSSSRDGGSAKEKVVAALARGHSKQKRSSLVWDSRLANAARARARDMATRGYLNHVDPDGYGPNEYITRAGYRLPLQWTAFKDANNVESYVAGLSDPEASFRWWMNSKKHVTHLLGFTDFYADQTRFGVGHVHLPNSPLRHYWVFLSAPPEK